jgi:hypothetical protein
VNAVDSLLKIFRPLHQLTSNLDDTILQSNSEAYTASLTYYSAVKSAMKAGEPGAKTIYEDLKERFPGRAKGSSDEEGDQENDPQS